MASEGLGAFAAAMLVAAIGPAWTFAIGGVLLPLVVLALRGQLRAVDVGVRVPAEDPALLRTTSIFEPLPSAALERLAATASRPRCRRDPC